jgi:hypothetical protein
MLQNAECLICDCHISDVQNFAWDRTVSNSSATCRIAVFLRPLQHGPEWNSCMSNVDVRYIYIYYQSVHYFDFDFEIRTSYHLYRLSI